MNARVAGRARRPSSPSRRALPSRARRRPTNSSTARRLPKVKAVGHHVARRRPGGAVRPPGRRSSSSRRRSRRIRALGPVRAAPRSRPRRARPRPTRRGRSVPGVREYDCPDVATCDDDPPPRRARWTGSKAARRAAATCGRATLTSAAVDVLGHAASSTTRSSSPYERGERTSGRGATRPRVVRRPPRSRASPWRAR